MFCYEISSLREIPEDHAARIQSVTHTLVDDVVLLTDVALGPDYNDCYLSDIADYTVANYLANPSVFPEVNHQVKDIKSRVEIVESDEHDYFADSSDDCFAHHQTPIAEIPLFDESDIYTSNYAVYQDAIPNLPVPERLAQVLDSHWILGKRESLIEDGVHLDTWPSQSFSRHLSAHAQWQGDTSG